MIIQRFSCLSCWLPAQVRFLALHIVPRAPSILEWSLSTARCGPEKKKRKGKTETNGNLTRMKGAICHLLQLKKHKARDRVQCKAPALHGWYLGWIPGNIKHKKIKIGTHNQWQIFLPSFSSAICFFRPWCSQFLDNYPMDTLCSAVYCRELNIELQASCCWSQKCPWFVSDHQQSPKIGSPGNHKSPSSALSSVLQSIPSGRKQKKIPAALKEVNIVFLQPDKSQNFAHIIQFFFHREKCLFPLQGICCIW